MSRPVLVVSPSWPADADDYRARFVWHHTQALAQAGAQVRVVAPGAGPAPDRVARVTLPERPRLFADGAPEALSAHPIRAALAGWRLTQRLTRAAADVVEPTDRLVAHWLLPAGQVVRKVAPGVAHCVVHGGDVALLERMPGGQRLARRLESRMFLTFVSRQLKRRYRNLLAQPFRREPDVLPMGVEPPQPDPAFRQTLRAQAGGRRIVATVGRLVPIKGLDVLAEALAGRSDVLWCAAGDGPERRALQARCEALGVAFAPLGALGPRQRDALLAEASAFCLSSRPLGPRTEGTPVALLEALVAGVPTVASQTGGVPMAVGDSGAVLVKPEDPLALRAGLDALLDASPGADAALRARHRAAGEGYLWATLGPKHAAIVLR